MQSLEMKYLIFIDGGAPPRASAAAIEQHTAALLEMAAAGMSLEATAKAASEQLPGVTVDTIKACLSSGLLACCWQPAALAPESPA